MKDNDTPSRERHDDADDALRADLLQYLSEHPGAADNLEGIVEWWLPRQHIRSSVERVARALRALTREGVIEEFSDGTRVLYRLRSTDRKKDD